MEINENDENKWWNELMRNLGCFLLEIDHIEKFISSAVHLVIKSKSSSFKNKCNRWRFLDGSWFVSNLNGFLSFDCVCSSFEQKKFQVNGLCDKLNVPIYWNLSYSPFHQTIQISPNGPLAIKKAFQVISIWIKWKSRAWKPTACK